MFWNTVNTRIELLANQVAQLNVELGRVRATAERAQEDARVTESKLQALLDYQGLTVSYPNWSYTVSKKPKSAKP